MTWSLRRRERTGHKSSWKARGHRSRLHTFAPAGEQLEDRRLLSLNPQLLKDNYVPDELSPFALTDVNGTLFFSATNTANGRELWKSDGTTAGTVRVKDIVPGSGSTVLQYLTNVNGTLYFVADDGVNGKELWKSDGTMAGTVLVKDIVSGSGSTALRYLTSVNGTLYFRASDGVNGQELWKSDGTAAGTVMVKDIRPGGSGASPYFLTNVNGTLYFSADDGVNGRELWKSDGTAAGTVLVKDRPGIAGYGPGSLTNVNGTLYFSADDGVNGRELWKSDGTAAGTVMVKDILPSSGSSSPEVLTNVNGTLFFTANDGVNGRELWKSDGTEAGTVLVKDISTGSGSGLLRYFTNVNGTLFFQGLTELGYELWKSDGTEAGTLVMDIWPGGGSAIPESLTNAGGTLFFTAKDGVNGRELWKSDGTEAGTVMVKDIVPGNSYASSDPRYLTNVNGTLFFSTRDAVNGVELWKSDGTEAGTVGVNTDAIDLDYGPGSEPRGFLTIGTTAYFTADHLNDRELWKSDGTAAGTVRVKDIFPGNYPVYPGGPNWGYPRALTDVNGTLFFTARDDPDSRGLWKSDGTAAGTVLLKRFFPFDTFDHTYLNELTNVNGTLYFSGNGGGGNGRELWKSDGTAAGTVMIKDIWPGSSSGYPSALRNVNGTLFFTATDGASGGELWKSDGTAAGTVLVKDIRPGSGHAIPQYLTNVNGTLYFVADDGVNGKELWKSDGTAAGTVLVKDIRPGSAGYGPFSSFARSLTNVNGTLFFRAVDGVNGGELWKSDGTAAGTVMVKDIRPGGSGAFPYFLTNVNGTLYFSADDGVNGRELWKSDGTAAGTVLVKDIRPGSASSGPGYLTNVNGTLFFAANDGVNGQELWQSDGTAAGTLMIADMVAGAGSSSPTNLANANGNLFFSAFTPDTGEEPWFVNPTAPGVTLAPPSADSSVTWNPPSGAPVAIAPSGALSDFNSAVLTSLTASIAGGGAAGDLLAADTSGTSIAANYTGGVLTLSGTDTVANYQQVLRSITYTNTAGGPGAQYVIVNVVATDDEGVTNSSATATISINSLAPVLALAPPNANNATTWNYGLPVTIAPSGTPSDADSATLTSLTASIAGGGAPGDVLAADTSSTSITANFAGGVLTLSGSDTVANYQQVLRSITYTNTAGSPGADYVIVNVVAADHAGLTSNSATVTITINSLAPVLALAPPSTNNSVTAYLPSGLPVIIAPGGTLSDADSATLTILTASIAGGGETGDVLAASTSGTSIAANYTGGVLTLSGPDTVANYQQVLRSITYKYTLGVPGVASKIINLVAHDHGNLASNVAVATVDVVDYQVLHNFMGTASDGSYPYGSLIQVGSAFYGMTAEGGSSNGGTIFQVGTDGVGFSVLHSFDSFFGGAEGYSPNGTLIQSGDTLYGMAASTVVGSGSGIVFRMDIDGTDFSVLHAFTGGGSDGSLPYDENFPHDTSLIQISDTLYGMTSHGGAADKGTIFRVNTDGFGFNVLHSFLGGIEDGSRPLGALMHSGSVLYGVTELGGGGDVGTIFRMNIDSSGFAVMHSFANGTDGRNPTGALVQSGSTLYGMTSGGHTWPTEPGTIFRVEEDGSGYSVLQTFPGGPAVGHASVGSLIVSGSTLYGMTRKAGDFDNGTIFQVDTDGSGFEVLHSFAGTPSDGGWPYGSLIKSGSTLYGMTSIGGSDDKGTIFGLTVSEEFTALVLGDMDGDGDLDNFDIQPFELALTDPDAYLAVYPLLTDYEQRGDIDGDDDFDNFDIQPFEQLLTGGAPSAASAPAVSIAVSAVQQVAPATLSAELSSSASGADVGGAAQESVPVRIEHHALAASLVEPSRSVSVVPRASNSAEADKAARDMIFRALATSGDADSDGSTLLWTRRNGRRPKGVAADTAEEVGSSLDSQLRDPLASKYAVV